MYFNDNILLQKWKCVKNLPCELKRYEKMIENVTNIKFILHFYDKVKNNPKWQFEIHTDVRSRITQDEILLKLNKSKILSCLLFKA